MRHQRISASAQFDKNAEKYRDEPLFAEGEDLLRMTHAVELNGSERLLDVGSGAGHVAIAFAPHVEACIGVDVSERMVGVATDFARTRGVANVRFETGNVEKLEFPDAVFDIVTCRFTAHHFIDLSAAVAEIARVLKPDGTLLVVDHYAPEDPELDRFVNDLDRMRDRSHVRESRLTEWQRLLAREGLEWELISEWDLPLELESWLDRAGTLPDERERIYRHLVEASPQCTEVFHIELDEEGRPHSFALKIALLRGTKRDPRT